MIRFEKLTLLQAPLLKRYFARDTGRLCDRSLGGVLMWRKSFDTDYALVEDILFFRSKIGGDCWCYTVPLGDVKRGVELLLEHCKETGEVLRFCSVGEEEKDLLLSLLPGHTAVATRDWFDYLYLAEKLSTFAGKKLSGQRNHKNFFLKNHTDWAFEPITEENLPEVRSFLDFYYASVQKESSYFQDERDAISEVLSNLSVYGFQGGLIRCEGKVCAFSLGEIIGDTLFVHIEKADRDLRGAYQMMVSEFISYYGKEPVVYVNREEDVGDPGLRYSKESYHPHRLLEKYVVEPKEEI